jgi:LAO/AO transport system kinase
MVNKGMTKPLTIGIGGAESGTGKTTLAAALLKCLTSPSSQGVCVSGAADAAPGPSRSSGEREESFSEAARWGAIKYTGTSLYASIIDDAAVLRRKGKDTRRLLDAGAAHVLWVQAPRDDAAEVLSLASDKLSYLDGIIIEGNSAIEFLRPDVVIFLCGGSTRAAKPSAARVLRQADIVILPNTACKSQLDSTRLDTRAHVPSGRLPAPVTLFRDPGEGCAETDACELVRMLQMIARRKEIERLLSEKAVAGKISCAAARAIAEELHVSYLEVGSVANDLKVKISACELGCF